MPEARRPQTRSSARRSASPTDLLSTDRRKTRRRSHARRSRSARGWLIAAGAIAAVVVVVVVVEVVASAGRVHPGVTVAGVSVGGMSQLEARLRIERQLLERAKSAPVVFGDGERTWKTDARSLGVSVDASGLATRAMEVGRSGTIGSAVADRMKAWIDPIDIPATVTVTPAKSDPFFASLGRAVAVAPRDAGVRLQGVKLSLVHSKLGQGLDRRAAERRLGVAFLSSKRSLKVPTSTVAPEITDDEARAALDVARAYLSGPATVTKGKKVWEFDPKRISEWVSFRPAGDPGAVRLEAYIDETAVAETTRGTFGKFGRPAENARFATSNGQVTIIPSKDGLGPDLGRLASELSTALAETDGPRSVALRIGRVKPELTTEKARAYGIKERLATYTTTFGSSNRPRVNNIHLLADALDGKLIPPGGTFSFNGAVGQRTAEKGYQEANAIVNGKLVPQLGGGICQVCTTLFNTVFFSGLPVVERTNHYFYISHYPAGRDATVSWGGPDFKFTNDTGRWLLVATSSTDWSITVSLYGTDPGYDVSYTDGEWTDIRPFKIQEVKDPKLPAGSKFVEDAGVDGRSIIVTRTVTKNGKVIRVDRFTSDYKPKVEIVRVGTKPVPKTTEPVVPKP